ncbi:hypothetical protein AB0L82_35700 [Nocardia sp. NPDC052001]|uniref:nSTAND1 domain-containing NTPase n=1 Tax=Nocardia sp. NPDC052001 TaxID=3154853 RepID=UPI003436FC69
MPENAGDQQPAARLPRDEFSFQLRGLWLAAGNPTLKEVTTDANKLVRARDGHGAKLIRLQRISDWRKGAVLPSTFDSVSPVLIELRKRASARPGAASDLLSMNQWRQLWVQAQQWVSGPDCPYRGLQPYRSSDTRLFFGRDEAVDQLRELVLTTATQGGGVVVLTGASGAGKSSLLAAGLIPALGEPVATATRASGVDLVAGVRAAFDAVVNARVLVIDQFEELFTGDASEEQRAEYVNDIQQRTRAGVTVILGLRADFFSRCLDYPVLAAALAHRAMVLEPMSAADLRAAITKPAETSGLTLEAGLADLAISELHDLGRHTGADGPGALPLLSHVMEATWQDRDKNQLTRQAYRHAGGVVGSVRHTAELAWAALAPDQREAAKTMLLSMIAVGQDARDTRRRLHTADLLARTDDPDAAIAAMEVLARARLITIDTDGVTLTHEIVLDAWPRLRAWIDEDRVGYLILQRLETDATDWAAAQRDPELLYRGGRLSTARTVADQLRPSPTGSEFLTRSHQAATRSRRWATGTRAGLAVLLVGVLLAGIAAIGQTRLKDARERDAALAAVLAEADGLRTSDPSLSAQLDLVARDLSSTDLEVRSRLLATQNMPLAQPIGAHDGEVTALAYQPTGRLLASAGADHTVALWSIADATRPVAVGNPLTMSGPVVALVFSPTTATLVVATDSTLGVWGVSDPEHPHQLAQRTRPGITRLAFASTTGYLLVSNADGSTQVWDTSVQSDPILLGETDVSGEATVALQVAASGAWFAVASATTVRFYSLADPRTPKPLGVPLNSAKAPIRAMVLDPHSGTTLAIGSGQDQVDSLGVDNAVVSLWNLANPAHPTPIGTEFTVARQSELRSLAFGPDGQSLAAGDHHGATVWSVADPSHPVQLGQPLLIQSAPCPMVNRLLDCQDSAAAMVFGPGGNTLVIGGVLGSVRVWSLPPAAIAGNWGWSAPFDISTTGRLVTSLVSGKTSLWDIADRTNPRLLSDALGSGLDPRYVYRPSISPDGTLIAMTVGATPPRTLILDVSDPTRIHTISDIPNMFGGGFTIDQKLMLAVEPGPTPMIHMWDMADRAHPIELAATFPLGTWPSPSPPGTGKAYAAVNDAGPGRQVALSADRAADGSKIYVLRLWDMSDPAHPALRATIPGDPARQFSDVRATTDGRTMVTLAGESLQAWDIHDLANPRTLGDPINTHGLTVQTLAISPDDSLLVTSSADSTVRVWDFTDRAHATPIGHSIAPPGTGLWEVHFSASGGYLIGARNGELAVWDLDENRAKQRICDTTHAILTEAAWRVHVRGLAYKPPC